MATTTPPTHSPTPPYTATASQPANLIGAAHHPRSVVSTRQAATCCDSTPLTHGTGPFDRLTAMDGLSPYTTGRHTRSRPPDSLRSHRVPQTHTHTHTHTHSPTRSQLTATEPKLVQSDDMSDWVN